MSALHAREMLVIGTFARGIANPEHFPCFTL